MIRSHCGSSFVLLSDNMMDDRAAKLRRLNSFRRRLPHCSANALAAILNDIKANGMPEGGTSRRGFKDARNLQNATQTPWGKTLQTTSVIDKDGCRATADHSSPHCIVVGSILRML